MSFENTFIEKDIWQYIFLIRYFANQRYSVIKELKQFRIPENLKLRFVVIKTKIGLIEFDCIWKDSILFLLLGQILNIRDK